MLPTSIESAAAYTDMRVRLTDALAGVPDADAAATPVPACPGWSVTDLVAHVYGVARDTCDGNLANAGSLEWTSAHVDRFSSIGLAGLVEAWNTVAPGFEEQAAGLPDRVSAQITFDAGVHEHDLRGALGRSGGRDAPSVLVGLEFMVAGMTRFVGRTGLPALSLDTPGFSTTIGSGPPGVRLTTDTFTLYRLITGRRSLDQIHALAWEGDPDPYLAMFDGAPIHPPADDIVE
ncbi:MAG: maleylpyruvate isomerase family mycothiol-dependent enzyme [Acidimicrobiales bacterium]